MGFIDKLKQAKKSLKQSSIDTYIRNVKRLRKVHGTLPIPEDHKWLLAEKLFTWFDKQPLNVRRHLSTAAQVALTAYGKESEKWRKRQKDSMKEFDADRRERRLTTKQKEKMPEKGFAALKQVVGDMRRELKRVLSKKHDEWTKPELLKVQDLLIISLYIDRPLRLDYAGLRVGKHEGNSIYKNMKKPRGYHVTLDDFKTKKSLGKQTFKLNAANQRLLNKFVPASSRITDHGFLLSNRNGGKMSKQVLSKRLTQVTKSRIGKGFSVQLLRVLYAMEHRKTLETAKEVSEKLMHSQEQSLQYSKKDDQ